MKKFLKLGAVLAALGLALALFASCSDAIVNGSSSGDASENGGGGSGGNNNPETAILEFANKCGNRWEGSGKYKDGDYEEGEATLQLAVYSLADFKKQSDLYAGWIKEDLDEAEEKNTKKGEVVFFLNMKYEGSKYDDSDIWLFPIDGTWYYEPEEIETVKSSLSQNGKQFTLVTEWNEKDGEYESNGKETVLLDISDDGSVKFKWTAVEVYGSNEYTEVIESSSALPKKEFFSAPNLQD